MTALSFDTLLVANRGEIACRIMRSAHILGLKTVAVYSDADAAAAHVEMADVAVRLGPAPAQESYLRADVVIEAALASGAGAIHPGYGFLSENEEFAVATEAAGIAFVGPTPRQLRVFGNKHSAREAARGRTGLVDVTLFGKQIWYRTPVQVHTTKSEFGVAPDQKTLPRVDIIYAHANMSPDLITAAAKNGAKGIVIAGVGDGNMTAPAFNELKKVVAQGVVGVRSSRTNGGIIRRNIELNDDQAGTVTSMELNPGKARALLQLALMKSSDAKTIQGYFDRY